MKQNLILFLLIMALGNSCTKYKQVIEPVPLPALNDTATILLKDIVSDNVPSPYYHFVYDSNKYVTEIHFASNLDIYKLEYDNKRLKRMLNINNNNRLEYTYTNNMVSLITEISGITGEKRYEVFFDYNSNNRLVQVNWFRFINNGATRRPYRRVMLTYYADGNLASTDDFHAEADGPLEWNSNKQYKDYDNGINVDDFSLLKNFFEPLFFLPSVRLQKNNARTEIITEIQNDFTINYHYEYHNGLPVTQEGTMTQTRGNGIGETFNFSIAYSYY